MASNNSSNTVKHKINGYSVRFSTNRNKWIVKDGEKTIMEGNFKECRKYCKTSKINNGKNK